MVCKYIRTYSLLCLWVISAGLIVANYQTNSSPQLSHYAVDTPESVLVVLGIMVAELIVLYLLLKPWQRPRSVIGSLVPLGIFTIWTFLSMILAMHGSNSVVIHVLWLFIVEVFLVVYTLYAFVAARSNPSN